MSGDAMNGLDEIAAVFFWLEDYAPQYLPDAIALDAPVFKSFEKARENYTRMVSAPDSVSWAVEEYREQARQWIARFEATE